MRSAFTSSTDRRLFIPFTSSSAQRVAAQALRAGVERLVHISGIGADAASPSRYIRKRGEGELAVRAAFADALFIRPAVMFGPDDAFLTTILRLLRQLPDLSDVRPRPDQIAAGLCGGCCGGDCSDHASEPRRNFDDLRVRRPSRLLLRGISQNRCAPSWPCAPPDSNPVCRLARTGMGLRNTPGSTPHS